jgi:hypothetical protein
MLQLTMHVSMYSQPSACISLPLRLALLNQCTSKQPIRRVINWLDADPFTIRYSIYISS